MNKDRIKINGKWYVAEQPEENVGFDSNELTYFKGVILETDSSCFEFTYLTNEEGELYDDTFSVEYTDKRFADRKDWKVDYWDNVSWFNGLIEGNIQSLSSLESTVDSKDVKLFIEALRYLKKD